MKYRGFTLAELLIALAILGVIATFTIPKVLNSQQDQAWNSAAKEMAGALSQAHKLLKLNAQLSASTTSQDYMQYINYVNLRTTGTTDSHYNATTLPCSSYRCYELHNGGILTASGHYYNGTDPGCSTFFYFDPDGEVDGTVGGHGKSLLFWIRYDGKIMTQGNVHSGSLRANCALPLTSNPPMDPPWFSW